jgi:hypothetical protein
MEGYMLWAVSTSAEAPMFVWALPPNVGGTAQRYRQEIGQFVGARSLVCRRGAQVNRQMEYEVGALERREGQQSVRCRKTSARGAKVTEILGMGCSTLRLACSEGIQRVDLTGVKWRVVLRLYAALSMTTRVLPPLCLVNSLTLQN